MTFFFSLHDLIQWSFNFVIESRIYLFQIYAISRFFLALAFAYRFFPLLFLIFIESICRRSLLSYCLNFFGASFYILNILNNLLFKLGRFVRNFIDIRIINNLVIGQNLLLHWFIFLYLLITFLLAFEVFPSIFLFLSFVLNFLLNIFLCFHVRRKSFSRWLS